MRSLKAPYGYEGYCFRAGSEQLVGNKAKVSPVESPEQPAQLIRAAPFLCRVCMLKPCMCMSRQL